MVAEGKEMGGDWGNILSGFNKRVSVLFMCYVHAQWGLHVKHEKTITIKWEKPFLNRKEKGKNPTSF